MTCGPRERRGHPVDSCHEGHLVFNVCKFPTLGDFEVDELIRLVAQRAGISSDQAALAVSAMMGYLTARLPSPLVGRIREQLGEAQNPRQLNVGDGGVR